MSLVVYGYAFFIFLKSLQGLEWEKWLKINLVAWEGVLALDDFLVLVDDDGGELGNGPPFKLGAHLKFDQWVLHKREEPVGDGHSGEEKTQPPHHPRQLEEEVGGLAKDQVYIDGQVEAHIVLHL